MTSHDTRDPAADRMTEIEHNASAAHYDDCDRTDAHACAAHIDLNDLVAFTRDVLALADDAEQPFYPCTGTVYDGKVPAGAIRDAAARHLGGQQI